MPVCDRLSGRWEARRHMLMIGAGLMTGLIGVGCAVDPPQVPRITIPFFISVANDTTTIRDVASDRSDFLQIGSPPDESLALNFDAEFGESSRQEVGEDRLAVSPNPAKFSTELGPITIPGQSDLDPDPVLLGDLLPDEVFDGFEVAVAADQPFNLPSQEIDLPTVELTLPNVRSMTVVEGGLSIEITNGFPMALAQLEISLIDDGGDGVPAKGTFSTVLFEEAGVGETSQPKVLSFNPDNEPDGNVMSGNLGLVVAGTTAEGNDIKALDREAVLAVGVDLLQLTVTQARAFIPEQPPFEDKQKLGFPDSRIRVKSAEIREGEITLVVINQIPVITSLALTLPDLTLGGVPATFETGQLAFGDSSRPVFTLKDYVFAPLDSDEIRIEYTAETFPSDGEVTISATDRITIEARPQRLTFGNVTGILDHLELPIAPVTQTVDFPEGLSNLSLDETELIVTATSGIGVESEMEILLTGFSNGVETTELVVNTVVPRASPDSPQPFEVRVTDELKAFLNALPDSIIVTPTVRIGDGMNEEFIEPDHWVQVDNVNFRAPARFTILNDTRIEPTPDFREFSDAEARERISNNLIQGRVFTEINNHLPIGVSVSLRVARRLEDVYDEELVDRGGSIHPDSVLVIPRNDDPFGVQAAPVDANGQVIDAQVQAFSDTVGVTKDEALFFLVEGGVYTGVLIQLEGTGGPVELRGDDFITVVAGTAIEIEINESLVK